MRPVGAGCVGESQLKRDSAFGAPIWPRVRQGWGLYASRRQGLAFGCYDGYLFRALDHVRPNDGAELAIPAAHPCAAEASRERRRTAPRLKPRC